MTASTTANNDEKKDNKDPPSHFICPLTHQVMSRPMSMFHGETERNFERTAIMDWISQGNMTCPLTGWPLKADELQVNMDLEREIRHWRKQQQQQPTQQPGQSWDKEVHKKSKSLSGCSTTTPLIRELICKTQASQVLSMRNKVLQQREERLRSLHATIEMSLVALSMDDDEEL